MTAESEAADILVQIISDGGEISQRDVAYDSQSHSEGEGDDGQDEQGPSNANKRRKRQADGETPVRRVVRKRMSSHKHRSFAWQHFSLIEDGAKAQCGHCPSILSSGSTTSLRYHLEHSHGIFQDPNAPPSTTGPPQTRRIRTPQKRQPGSTTWNFPPNAIREIHQELVHLEVPTFNETGQHHHNGYEEGLPVIQLLGSMRYGDFRVKIFKQVSDHMENFFYEPVVVFDPKSVRAAATGSGQHQVRFRVQMWDGEVQCNAIEWLNGRKSLKKINEDDDVDVQIMPYDEVRLVMKKAADEGGSSSTFFLPDVSTPYYTLKESLPFFLLCGSMEAAQQLVEEIKSDPESWLDENLQLECTARTLQKHPHQSGSASGSTSQPGIQQRFGFNVVDRHGAEVENDPFQDSGRLGNLQIQVNQLAADVGGIYKSIALSRFD